MLPLGDPGRFQRLPLARSGRPDEVAELVLFLSSDASSYITGGEFAIDAGLIVGP
jgi:3alpha(or 20beta)-hydroxysteroid dehydrogenase